MQPADMKENRCNEAPPLTFRNGGVGFDAEGHERWLIGASAGERHQKKHRDVQAEKDVGVRRAPRPDGVKKLEVIFRNHFPWSGIQFGDGCQIT